MKTLFRAIATLCLLAAPALSQTAYWYHDNTFGTVSSVGPSTVRTQPGSIVTVCNYPATILSAGQPCTNLATLYTDASASVVCTGANGCSNPLTSDNKANFGFWAMPGHYQYTVTANGTTTAPYDVTIGGSGGGGGGGNASTNVQQIWTAQQAFGSNCPQAMWGLNAQAVNGIINAGCYIGSDWAVKVTAATSALPSQGGTVFIPSSMQGATSVGGITVPNNVSLQFDSGTFTLGDKMLVVGSNHSISGTRGSTYLVFSGGTDGVVIQGGIPNVFERYTVLRDLTLQTTNTGGGAAFRCDDNIGAPSKITLDRVNINTRGNSTVNEWAYGIHLVNLQYSLFLDVNISGSVNVGLHTEGTEENSFIHMFINENLVVGLGFRGVEALKNVAKGFTSNDRFYGGGCYGGFTGSAFYVNQGGSAHLEGGFKGDNPSPATLSDGAYFVADSAKLFINSSGIASSLLVINGGQVSIEGGSVGDITIDPTAFQFTMVGANYHSLTNGKPGSSSVTLLGNTQWSGAVDPFAMPGCSATGSLLTCNQVQSTSPFLAGNGVYTSVAGQDMWLQAPSGQSLHFGANATSNFWSLTTAGDFKQVQGSQGIYVGNVSFQTAGLGSQTGTMSAAALTAHRTYGLPDASGTLPLLGSTPNSGNLLVAGTLDGSAPVTISLGTSTALGGTYKSGYTFNQNSSAAIAVSYSLPVAAAGEQYCVKNSYNGTAANTGAITLQTSGTGQFLISNGALSASGGYIVSAGAAGDALCAVAINSTQWETYAQSGTWTLH